MPKTSQYPAMTGLTGSERLVGVQGTSTETVTLEQLAEYFVVNSDGVSPADLEAAIADKANAPDLAADDGAAMVGYKPSATGAVKRPVKDKLGDVLSVKDFGAKGDGVTDDTAAIKLALAAGVGYFPRGTYLTTGDFTIPAGLDIHGRGESTVIKCNTLTNGSTGYRIFHATAVSNWTVRDLTMDL